MKSLSVIRDHREPTLVEDLRLRGLLTALLHIPFWMTALISSPVWLPIYLIAVAAKHWSK
jgi:hypothetical protein